MPFYHRIDGETEAGRRTAEGLLRLKEGFREAGAPKHDLDDTLLLATWNVREFDSAKYGERGQEPLLYIAEIIGRFDLVAVQEVWEDLSALDRLTDFLGAGGATWNRRDRGQARGPGAHGNVADDLVEVKDGS